MKIWSVRRVAGLGLICFVVFAAVQSACFYHYATKTREAKQWVVHTHDVIEQLQELLSDVKDAESSERGFLLTGRANALDAYRRTVGDQTQDPLGNGTIAEALNSIADLTADNSVQQDNVDLLQQLITRKLVFLKRIIDLRESQRLGTAMNLVRTEKGIALMESIRSQTAKMIAEEERLLVARTKAEKVTARRYISFTVMTLSATYLIFLIIILAIIRNYIRLQQTEAQIKESEERFQRAMRGSRDGIWEWDMRKNKIYYSPRFLEILGYQEGEIGTTLEDWQKLRHPEDAPLVIEKIEKSLKERVPYEMVYRVRAKSGEYKWIDSRGQVEWDDKGEPIRLSGSLTDVSEKKRMENLKQEFVYTVTHELRTPLTALKGAVDTLQYLLGHDVPQNVKNMIDLAMRGSDRLMLLINDLLDVGKIESGQMAMEMRHVQLSTLLHDSIEMNAPYADKYQVRFDLQQPIPKVVLFVDPDRFAQIMANLLSNAAKYSPENGVIAIRTLCTETHVRISISDQGPGIPESLKPRLFQKFAQGPEKGTESKGGSGLGLHITKNLVQRMNGEIGFESEPGQGATFFIEFPLVPGANQSSAG